MPWRLLSVRRGHAKPGLGRRSRSRPAAAKRAANGGGLEGDRWPRNNAAAIGGPPNIGQCPSRQVPTSTPQGIFHAPTVWPFPSLIFVSSACSCRFRGSLRGRDIARAHHGLRKLRHPIVDSAMPLLPKACNILCGIAVASSRQGQVYRPVTTDLANSRSP